jgi:hypothetical protein
MHALWQLISSKSPTNQFNERSLNSVDRDEKMTALRMSRPTSAATHYNRPEVITVPNDIGSEFKHQQKHGIMTDIPPRKQSVLLSVWTDCDSMVRVRTPQLGSAYFSKYKSIGRLQSRSRQIYRTDTGYTMNNNDLLLSWIRTLLMEFS